MKENRKNLGYIKKLAGAAVLSASIAACGSSAEQTAVNSVTQAPETPAATTVFESPSPYVSLQPSPEPTTTLVVPSGTANETPVPEITPTPKATENTGVTSVIKDKLPETPVSINTIKADINKAFEENPTSKVIWSNTDTLLNNCQNGIPGAGGAQQEAAVRLQTCENIIANSYSLFYNTKNSQFRTIAQDTYYYILGPYGLGWSYKNQLDSYIRTYLT